MLVCPLANPVASRREGAYTEIISLASQFRANGAAPHPELPDEESMQKNRASWHISCRQLYSATMHKKLIMKDCPMQEKDPVGVMQLLIVICVSSVVMKQMH